MRQGNPNRDEVHTREKALLATALERLEETAGLKARGIRWERVPGLEREAFRVDFGPPLRAHWVEFRGEVTPARLGPILEAIGRPPRRGLLVAPYIPTPMALRLRREGVHFLDGQGNAYLAYKFPQFFVWVTGNRPAKPKAGEKPLRIFRAAGLKVIFALLCLPAQEAEGATYRDLAGRAGVALGTVAKAIEELEHTGYLRRTKTRLVIENRARLLEAWVDAYPRELRPRLQPRRFWTDLGEWWKGADFERLGAWLGGEPAAAMMTKHLRPITATTYLEGGLPDLAKALRLAKDEEGNVEVLQKFWFFDQEARKGLRLVPPLLVYADLMATGEARNRETAAIIRERFLERT